MIGKLKKYAAFFSVLLSVLLLGSLVAAEEPDLGKLLAKQLTASRGKKTDIMGGAMDYSNFAGQQETYLKMLELQNEGEPSKIEEEYRFRISSQNAFAKKLYLTGDPENPEELCDSAGQSPADLASLAKKQEGTSAAPDSAAISGMLGQQSTTASQKEALQRALSTGVPSATTSSATKKQGQSGKKQMLDIATEQQAFPFPLKPNCKPENVMIRHLRKIKRDVMSQIHDLSTSFQDTQSQDTQQRDSRPKSQQSTNGQYSDTRPADTLSADTDTQSHTQSELAKVRELKSKKMLEGLQSQLMQIMDMEAKYSRGEIESLATDMDKFKADSEVKGLYKRLLSASKLLFVPPDISQYGYNLFYLSPTAFAQSSDSAISDDYVLGPGDSLNINLSGSVNDVIEAVVSRDGTIAVLNERPFHVGGLTIGKVTSIVEKMVREKLVGVTASVSIGKLRWFRIFAMGDMANPGSCMISGMSNVSNAILVCGGVAKNGSLRNIQLLRHGKKIASIDFYDFLLKGDTSKDPQIQPGDVLFVPPIQDTVAIAGEVNRPAIYELNGKTSLGDLISVSGGLRPTSLLQMAQIERIDSNGKMSVIDVNLEKDNRNLALRNGDILKVFSILQTEDTSDTVYVVGNVKHAGKRAFKKGMRISDVIRDTSDLLIETYLDYGLIERESGLDRSAELIRFDIGKMLTGVAEQNLELKQRDKIYIFNDSSFHERISVAVEGMVANPGKYDYKKGMRVIDLILLSGGLLKDAQLSSAELYTTDPATDSDILTRVNLSKVMDKDEGQNRHLRDGDRLVIHSALEEKPKMTVSIAGEVNHPGKFPYTEGSTVADIIFAAGGLTEKAYRKEAEIARYEVVGNEQRVTHRIAVNLLTALEGDAKDNIRLKPYDQLLVRQIRDWGSHAWAKIEGEVLFPGVYKIGDGETIESLIMRAGGLTHRAYPYGARFTRKSIATLQEQQFKEMADKLERDSMRYALSPISLGGEKSMEKQQFALGSIKAMAEKLRNDKPEGRMVVDLDGSSKHHHGGSANVRLEEGDTLYIPRVPDALLIMGSVYNPNAFNYNPRKSVREYLNMAGGYTENANPDGTYIIKANGEVVPLKSGFFFSTQLGPGDVIMVPEKIEQYSGLEATKDVSQVLYQLAITAASMKTIGVIK